MGTAQWNAPSPSAIPKPDEPDQSLRVVAPCGACRENLLDYDAAADVIVPTPAGLRRVLVRALLPMPYQR